MTLEYRLYKDGDEKEIIKLFTLSFNKDMDPTYWKWRYKDNLLKNNFINLVIDDDVIAAHYALSPTKLVIDEKIVKSGLSMTTMTHPDYRGQRLFTKSAEDLYGKCKNELDVIYGVPNNNSIKGFVKHLNFKVIQEIRGYELKSPKLMDQINIENCKTIDRFDNRFDDLMDSIARKYRILLSRDSQFLNWRFVDNPQNNYNVFSYEKDGELLGYIVSKVFIGGGEICGDIVDVVALDESIFSSLIHTACNELVQQNVDIIKLWINDKLYADYLLLLGFVEGKEIYNFIVRNNNELDDDVLLDFGNWYLTMSDIDIF